MALGTLGGVNHFSFRSIFTPEQNILPDGVVKKRLALVLLLQKNG
jgi:hypothetical protein